MATKARKHEKCKGLVSCFRVFVADRSRTPCIQLRDVGGPNRPALLLSRIATHERRPTRPTVRQRAGAAVRREYSDAHARRARANTGRSDLDRDPVHAGPGAGGLPLRLVRDRRLRRRKPGLPDQRTGRAHQEPRAGSSRVAAGGRERRRRSARQRPRHDARTVHARRRRWRQRPRRVPGRASERRLLRRLPRLRVLEAAGRMPSATSGATAGCRGSARPTGRPPSRIRSRPSAAGSDRSHERRPRRRDGALLQGVFEGDRYHLRDA